MMLVESALATPCRQACLIIVRASGQREESEEVDAFTDKTEMKGKITSLPGSAGVLC